MIQDALIELVGSPPPGLEFLSYLFAVIMVAVGLFLVLKLIKSFFGFFIK